MTTTGSPATPPTVPPATSPAPPTTPSRPVTAPSFSVIPGAQVLRALQGREREVVHLIETTYRMHGTGDTVNPPSYFLRFPDRPSSRIIALPASVDGQVRIDGLKWVSSVPENVASGLPRASAVLILNDQDTGFPIACLEASIISAMRTAASAALAADHLSRTRPRPTRAGFVGAGLIASYIHTFLTGTGWAFDEIGVYDISARSAAGFREHLQGADVPGQVTVHDSAEQLIRSSDLVIFATVASSPHVSDLSWFEHHPVVLHVSLRDLAPEVLFGAVNIVDDVDHCLREKTSPHLAEQLCGNRTFVAGTLDDVLTGRVEIPADRLVVFSPFGLGVLDLAVGRLVYDELERSGQLQVVDGFFHQTRRHGS